MELGQLCHQSQNISTRQGPEMIIRCNSGAWLRGTWTSVQGFPSAVLVPAVCWGHSCSRHPRFAAFCLTVPLAADDFCLQQMAQPAHSQPCLALSPWQSHCRETVLWSLHLTQGWHLWNQTNFKIIQKSGFMYTKLNIHQYLRKWQFWI